MSFFSKQILILLVIVMASCKNNKADMVSPPSNPSNATATVTESGPEIPGIPKDVMVKLLNECTYLDYIFHKLPFSLSQNEDPSIDQNISFIDIEKPLGRIPSHCKPDARKFFQIKGEVVYEADVYILNGCKFYVFVDKNSKPIYANYMTQAGINFYDNIIQQAAGMTPQH
jgi:hypothetical protein